MKDKYFQHDFNAKNDKHSIAILSNYGAAGYGLFWLIVEELHKETKIELNEIFYNNLAFQSKTKKIKVEKFVKFCIENNIFEVKIKFLISRRVLKNLNKIEEISKTRKNAINKRWGNTKELQKNYKSNTNVIQNDTKETKLKEIKLKETKLNEKKEKKDKKNIKEKNIKKENEFIDLWNIYSKKTSNKKRSHDLYLKLTEIESQAIKENLKSYIESTPDKKYRKNLETYLFQKTYLESFENENTKQIDKREQNIIDNIDYINKHY